MRFYFPDSQDQVDPSFDFLTEDDKIAIFNRNPLKLFPAFAKVGKAVATA